MTIDSTNIPPSVLSLRIGNLDPILLSSSTGRSIHRIIKRLTETEDQFGGVGTLMCSVRNDCTPVSLRGLKTTGTMRIMSWLNGSARSCVINALSEYESTLYQLSRIRSDRPIFLDMDGVAADFDAGFVNAFGIHYKSMPGREEMWAAIDSYSNFYARLPVYPLFHKFYNAIAHLNVQFLSSCRTPEYAADKKQWIAWSLLPIKPLIPVLPDANGVFDKTAHFKPGSILIDDYTHNTDEWQRMGGTGIDHECFTVTARRLLAELQSDNADV